MNTYKFGTAEPFSFNWTGKFEAPDENWIHMTRELLDFELVLMTKGTLYIASDDKKFEVHEGEYLLMCPPCHQYGFKASCCSFYWTHFTYNNNQNNPEILTGEEALTPLPDGHTAILLPETGKIPRLDRLIVLLKQLQDCDRKYGNHNQNNFILTSILCELYSQIYLSAGRMTVKGGQIQLYTDIVDYISWRIREPIRVSEIAAYFGYNEKYITTFFKKNGGSSLKNYILTRKMELAKAMLTDSNLPIAQIGYDIGFSDNHNFSSAFKKVTGQSPSDYRNTYAQRQMFHQ